MGVIVHLLLATVCVVTLATVTLGQSHCKTTSWGDLSGTPRTYTPIILQPAIRDWQLTIAQPPECTYGQVVGVSVTGCDYDKPSQLKFLDKLLVYVHRTGRTEYAASATATVYCRPMFGGAKDQSPQLEASAWDGSNWHKESGLIATPN